MKINILLFFLCVALGLGWTIYHDQKQLGTIPLKPAPEFTYKMISNETAALHDHKGQVTLIHFWATWCPPCLKELPTLIDLAHSEEDLVVLAVAVNDSEDKINRFLKKIEKILPDNFIVALDADQKISKDLYGTVKLPESFLLNPAHQISRKIIGAEENWNSDLWKKKIKNASKN